MVGGGVAVCCGCVCVCVCVRTCMHVGSLMYRDGRSLFIL